MLVLTNDLLGIIFDFCNLSLFALDYATAACTTDAAGVGDDASAAAIATIATDALICAIADTAATVDVTIAHVDITIAVLRWEIIIV